MKQKGLQRFTDLKSKFDYLLNLKKIDLAEYKKILNENERAEFSRYVTKLFNELIGEDRDRMWEKLENLTAEESRNQFWEYNHNQIMWAISTLMQENGQMPTKIEIATKTKLSRQTVHKHLKEYASHPQYVEQIEQFRFMTSKVLARVYKFAMNGDMRAAKLYLNAIGFLNTQFTPNNTMIKNQNNYIQINGTVLSQETIKHLNSEQLNTIENILKTALPIVEYK